jgi:hypothetical protein
MKDDLDFAAMSCRAALKSDLPHFRCSPEGENLTCSIVEGVSQHIDLVRSSLPSSEQR